MLRDVLIWWARQWADLLPGGLGGARSLFRHAVVVRPGTGAALSAFLRRGGTETPLGPVAAGDATLRRRPSPVVLALPEAAVLQQLATLPLAAEREMAAVLEHEMDRLTPFRAADLVWGWRPVSRDRAGGKITLRLLLVPKAAIAGSLSLLHAAGLRPAALEVQTGGGGTEHLPLDATPGRSRRAALAGGWACAALAAAVLLLPPLRQEWAIGRTEAQVAALRPAVAQVDALRRRVAATGSGASLFAAEVARVGNPLGAIAALTTALPDDTFLTSLSLRQRRLAVAGQSAGAARLIGALSAEPALRDPAFDAPVTRLAGRTDLFSIRATLAP